MLLPRYVNEVTCSIGSFSMVKLLLGFMGSMLAVMYFDFWQFNFKPTEAAIRIIWPVIICVESIDSARTAISSANVRSVIDRCDG